MSIDPEILTQTTCPIEMLCEHDDTFLWPFFSVGGGLVASETCLTCGTKMTGGTKILNNDGVVYDYV